MQIQLEAILIHADGQFIPYVLRFNIGSLGLKIEHIEFSLLHPYYGKLTSLISANQSINFRLFMNRNDIATLMFTNLSIIKQYYTIKLKVS